MRPFIPVEINNKSLVQVFENNLALIEQGWFTAPNGQRVDLNVNKNLAEETIVYKEQIVNENTANHFDTRIEVRHIDCLDMARELVKEKGSERVAVLNMANSRNPIARVTHGAREQEAYLMRCSDYYNALVSHRDAYPIKGDHMGIYTPGVTVFRNSDYQMADEPWTVNIIAVSGIRRPDTSDVQVLFSYMLGFQNKIRTILRIAIAHDQTNLVLGAMGCGGLNNIPLTIAKMFHSVLSEKEFSGAFEHIVFAMLPVEGEDETFDAFRAEFPEEETQVEVQEEVAQPEAQEEVAQLEAQEEVAQPEVPEEITPEGNEILQTLKNEFTAPPFRVDGTLTPEQRMRMITLIDNRQLNEDSAREELGVHLIEALFLFAGWLRNQGIGRLNLDYLILEQYGGNQQELDEDDQLKLNDIIIPFYDELSDSQGATAASLFSELVDDYQDDELAELFVAIGYIYAVQKINSEHHALVKTKVKSNLINTTVKMEAEEVIIAGIKYGLFEEDQTAEVRENDYSGNIVIPETVEHEGVKYDVKWINEYAFSGCDGLTSISIPKSLEIIGDGAFCNCNALYSVCISDLEAWCKLEFDDWEEDTANPLVYARTLLLNGKEIKDLVIPDGLTEIRDGAFMGIGLTSVDIPDTVTKIGKEAFVCNVDLTSIEIPDSVSEIGCEAFRDCVSLQSVPLHNSVKKIGMAAFSGCTALETNPFNDSLTIIESNTFRNCTSLTHVCIPNSIVKIDWDAFAGCTGITEVKIGNGIKEIGSGAFSSAIQVADVYCNAEKVPETATDAFANSNIKNATLHVPAASVEKYRNAEPWKQFGDIIPLAEEGLAGRVERGETHMSFDSFMNLFKPRNNKQE